ncbi:MAG: Tryptophan synthase alpha chain [Deltaproteobacteria bacterium]|nr:Tryptophan synthase alpha chain [Deltaproteobacteria bacterium]
MRRAVLISIVVGGCGNDHAFQTPEVDAIVLPPGTPLVTVSSPRLNDSYYMTQGVQIAWMATGTQAMTCDVVGIDGSASLPIAANLAASDGMAMMTDWTLTTVPASSSYVVEVTCHNNTTPTLVGTGTSGVFSVTGPPQQVSYASQVKPLWATCTSNQCHDNTAPQQGLNLTAAGSYAAIVGVTSQQCASTKLVKAGAPDQSYLLFKLQGSGSCYSGSRMPKAMPAFTAAQLQLVRDWIANGAPNN